MRASYLNGHEGTRVQAFGSGRPGCDGTQHKCCGHPLQRGAGVNRGGVAKKGSLSVLRTNSEIIRRTQRHKRLMTTCTYDDPRGTEGRTNTCHLTLVSIEFIEPVVSGLT